jgi:hypothetical protein
MTPEIEDQTIALLRAHPDFAMPLAELHRELTVFFGEEVGTRQRLRESIERRTTSFLVLESPSEAWNIAPPGSALRAAVQSAMRAAGWDAEPLVVLLRLPAPGPDTRVDASESLLQQIRGTLVPVLARAPNGSDLQSAAAEALTAANELRRALAS